MQFTSVSELNNECVYHLNRYVVTHDSTILKFLLQHFYELTSINQIQIIGTLNNVALLQKSLQYWKKQKIIPNLLFFQPMLMGILSNEVVSLQDLQEILELIDVPYVGYNWYDNSHQRKWHSNGTDMIVDNESYYNMLCEDHNIQNFQKFVDLYTDYKSKNYRKPFLNQMKLKCLLWAEFLIDKGLQNQNEYVYFTAALEALYSSRLLTYNHLHNVWIANNTRMHKIQISDINQFWDAQVLMDISPELHQLYLEIQAWYNQQRFDQYDRFDVQQNNYADAHSIHKLDCFRSVYLEWINKTVLTNEQLQETESFIEKLSKVVDDDADIILGSIQEIKLYKTKFVPKSNEQISLTMQDIFQRISWVIMNLSNDEATKRLQQELKDMYGTCISGHINRLFNALTGFVEIDVLNLQSLVNQWIQQKIQSHEQSTELIEAIGSNEIDVKILADIHIIIKEIFDMMKQQKYFCDQNQEANIKILHECLKHTFGASVQQFITIDDITKILSNEA